MKSKLENDLIKKAISSADLDFLRDYPQWHTAILNVPELALGANETLPALHYAASMNRLSLIKLVLDSNPELINSIDTYNQTLVCIACLKNYLPMLDYLIEKKADLNKPSAFISKNIVHRQTPIIWATINGNLEVIKRLVAAGVDFNEPVNENNVHLIHIASQFGFLNVLQYFLELDPSLLDRPDDDGSSPLEWAAMKGRHNIANYLLTVSQNSSGSAKISSESVKRSYQVAMDSGYYRFASILLLNSLGDKRYTANIIPNVTNALFAIELMRIDPKLINILMDNQGIAKMVADQGAVIERTDKGAKIKCYKPKGRRNSLVLIADGVNQQAETYEPTASLGMGGYAEVRLFKSKDQKKIAVRSPLKPYKNMQPSDLNALECNLQQEIMITRHLYKNDTISDYFMIWLNDHNWTTRQLMQHVEGEDLSALKENILCEHEAAKITLRIAQELQRCHDLGVIIGDLNSANIMVNYENNDYQIRFVDLGDSYYLSGVTAKLRNLSENTRLWFPPEICNGGENMVKPATSQNVYSFAYILNRVWGSKALGQQLFEKYPCIRNFITISTDIDPNMRESLTNFITQLSAEIVNNQEKKLTAVLSL